MSSFKNDTLIPTSTQLFQVSGKFAIVLTLIFEKKIRNFLFRDLFFWKNSEKCILSTRFFGPL